MELTDRSCVAGEARCAPKGAKKLDLTADELDGKWAETKKEGPALGFKGQVVSKQPPMTLNALSSSTENGPLLEDNPG